MDSIPLPTQNQWRILVFMYPDNKIKFKDQKILTQERWFHREMKKLIRWGRVELVNEINGTFDHDSAVYKLTFNGKIIVEFVENYYKRNKGFL
jgi:hypothetical protein